MIGPAAVPVVTDGDGRTSVEHTVHERYLRAFAAGVGDLSPALFDLDSPAGIVAHPVYPVCLEWPLILAGPPGLGLDDDAVHAGLHVSHEIAWTRPIRPGDTLRTTLRVETLQQRSVGVLAIFALATTGDDGEPVVESHQGVLYRGSTLGVAPIGSETPRPPAPAPTGALHEVAGFRVEPADAVVYSECSGIWNPIHTDPRAARLADLPHPVLHGTATLARTISAVVGSRLGGDPTRVARIACRFTAPIATGDEATVAVSEFDDGEALAFRTSKSTVAVLDGGVVEARPS